MVATGAHTALSMAVRDVVGSIDATAAVGLDPQFLWVGGVVWTRLVLAILAVVVLAGYSHREPNRGYLMLGLIAAVGVVGGVTSLLTLVVSP